VIITGESRDQPLQHRMEKGAFPSSARREGDGEKGEKSLGNKKSKIKGRRRKSVLVWVEFQLGRSPASFSFIEGKRKGTKTFSREELIIQIQGGCKRPNGARTPNNASVLLVCVREKDLVKKGGERPQPSAGKFSSRSSQEGSKTELGGSPEAS